MLMLRPMTFGSPAYRPCHSPPLRMTTCGSPQNWLGGQCIKIIPAHSSAFNQLRRAVAREIEIRDSPSDSLLERSVLFLKIEEVRRGSNSAACPSAFLETKHFVRADCRLDCRE